ncbi:MAG: hypothetical protein K6F53_08250 [Lachnospiraceae bacterium]|nr:hypothetical protein [Lachnospiraceae bacterium]
MSERIGYKVYVDVDATFTSDGGLLPRSLVWEDGRRYTIDRIRKIERCASRRAGGAGIMYTCLVSGREIHLFYEENMRWFLESKL